MMRNNIKSLIIHIPIIIAVIFLNVSHISKTNSDGIVGAIGLHISVIISLLYILYGYVILENKGSFKKNMLSVSILILI